MRNLYVVGCGRMGGALVSRLPEKAFAHVYVADRTPEFVDTHAGAAQVILLAVKPGALQEAAKTLARISAPGAWVISVLAGVEARHIVEAVAAAGGASVQVIRTMPNIAVTAGAGTTAVFTEEMLLDEKQRRVLQYVFGDGIVYLADENDAAAVTALSGSGPAYFFYFVEALAAAGAAAGLSPERAAELARRTLCDAAALLHAEPETSPTQLRARVTSPGGTTAAALQHLMPALDVAVSASVNAAIARCGELIQK